MLALLLSLFAGLGLAASGGGGGGGKALAKQADTNADSNANAEQSSTDKNSFGSTTHNDFVAHPTPQDSGQDHDGGQDQNHDGGQDQNHDGGHDHGHTGGGIDLPTTQVEIDAFVAMVRTGEELHVHDAGSSKVGEHMAILNLVSPEDATHIAIGHGSWFDPGNWHNGEVPGDDSMVVIPDGVHIRYDDESDARLFTLRVDGKLDFASDQDSKMVVDTFVVSPSGELFVGTKEDPIEDDVKVDIVIANNGEIDTNWDTSLLSRGLISHGKTEIHGMEKDSHEKVIEDPMAGDTSISFKDIPEGWQVGDKIVIAGTNYEGHKWDNDLKKVRYHEPEDEVRIITEISGNDVYFDEALDFDHDTPRDDLFTSVANYSRNVTVRSEDGDASEIYERGHVMLMHSDDVDIRYAAFEDLGRTNKIKLAKEADDFDNLAFDSNVSGRYSLHLHRLGINDADKPAIIIGNAVDGSPGWGFVHHDSNAILDNNASYDTFGAGFVSETGNEIGLWNDNIAIDARGRTGADVKVQIGPDEGLREFDTAVSGDGFWFQSRMVESTNNVAASVNHGFVYFHRGDVTGDVGDRQLKFDAKITELPEALFHDTDLVSTHVPVLQFEGNEVFAAKDGLQVVKGTPNQGHDVHSVFEDFTAWNVVTGAFFDYTSHYVLKDFDLIAREDAPYKAAESGIDYGNNISDFVVVDSSIVGFRDGINFKKELVGFDWLDDDAHDFFVVNTDVSDNDTNFKNYDPDLDQILDTSDIGPYEVSLELDKDLSFSDAEGLLRILGTKTDGLGDIRFPAGTDFISLNRSDINNMLNDTGYYTTTDGTNYIVFDLYFSDRLTGEVYKQAEKIELADDIDFDRGWGIYQTAVFNGVITPEELEDMTSTDPERVIIQDRASEQLEMLNTQHADDMHHDDGIDTMKALTQGQGAHSEHMPMDEQEDVQFQQHMEMEIF